MGAWLWELGPCKRGSSCASAIIPAPSCSSRRCARCQPGWLSLSPELQPHFAHPNTPWSSLSPLHPQAQCYILCLDGSSLALGHPGQPLLLWGCRFEDTAIGVAACQAKIHPVPSYRALWGTPCYPLPGKQAGGRGARPGRTSVLPASRCQGCPHRVFISITIQYSSAALSLLYIYQYYQLILRFPLRGFINIAL